jgi:hypothetical protein
VPRVSRVAEKEIHLTCAPSPFREETVNFDLADRPPAGFPTIRAHTHLNEGGTHDGVAESHEKKVSMTVQDMPPLFERGSGTAKTMGGSDMTKFVQICASQNDLFALDAEGDIYQYHFNIKAWVKLIANRESEEGIPSGGTWPQSARPHNGEGRIGEDKGHGVLGATPD